MKTYTPSDITALREQMETFLRNPDTPAPTWANENGFFAFLVGYMAPWCIGKRHGNIEICNNTVRHLNEAGQLSLLAAEGHQGRPSLTLRKILLGSIANTNRRGVNLACHQAYWKVTPYPDFTRRTGGAINFLPGTNEFNALGYILRQPDALDVATGVAFMLPGLVANRPEYWLERFTRAGADPQEIPGFIEGLQAYWEAGLNTA